VIHERLRPVLEATQPLAERFTAAGHRLYLVGGIVRDLLDGREIERPARRSRTMPPTR
jgi:tRNA nucleotidyltransferase/poly(A) polymerase